MHIGQLCIIHCLQEIMLSKQGGLLDTELGGNLSGVKFCLRVLIQFLTHGVH